MVAQRELDDRLRAVVAQLAVEERDWRDEERKLFELEETYLRDTAVHGNVFTGWGDAKTAPVRFRNAALRKKKRERQPLGAPPALSAEEQLKVDRHRVASYSSVTSPAEPLRAKVQQPDNDSTVSASASSSSSPASATSTAATPAPATTPTSVPTRDSKRAASQDGVAKPSPAKKARK